MTTARERYEQKTRVVTFRVSNEVFDQLEKVKAEASLSNADLVKLGAGIVTEEIKQKLEEISGLNARLANLRQAIGDEERRADEERQRRREETEKEVKTFKLFSAGWGVEEVAFKFGIPEETVRKLYDEWAGMVGDKEAARQELFRGYLKKHLASLKNRKWWANIVPSSTKEERRELEEQIDYCGYLLSHPSEINEEWAELLIAEYSTK